MLRPPRDRVVAPDLPAPLVDDEALLCKISKYD